MAKLYFNYSSMNAGKSTALLQANHNYLERGMKTKMFTFSGDNRYEENRIVSRIGISADALPFSEDTDLFQSLIEDKDQIEIKCVLIDEAQFLTKKQVAQLGKIADELDTAVLAFGIRTDFQGELFEGSKYLLAWADNLKEIKTVCWCGRKATMVVRLDKEGNIVSQGEQLEIGGNEKYVPLCRAHFNKKKLGN
ncbi:MAG: thymidine kinase [SAR86 cluster bacterium]|jgi:thymidine kinase|nr:thymidine kinase [SAR86 cluster bacterium]|tara:strand:+ start:37 stop:618 length:582 start_codon:yes stop_codon:yes gene_type:complete